MFVNRTAKLFESFPSLPILIILLTLFPINNVLAEPTIVKPKLVLQITVDQLRGDLPFRYQERFVKNGFNYLLNKGTVYRDAHHGHANTETVVGHVTLATGSHPSSHGLIGNVWYDRKMEKTVYNIEDTAHKLLTDSADIDKNTEIDPTQKAASVDGRSPRNINVSTISDEILINSAGKAKVFSISVKDRGAVAMAGHGGKALWFSKSAQEFVSSDYYFNRYPQWIVDWNAKKIPAEYANKKWRLLNDKSTYLFANKDDNAWEAEISGYKKVFPHPFGDSSSPYFSTLLTISPVGDELTSDFAKHLIINEDLGKDSITDYLAISFSSTDYIGHFFGPSSLESEDNLLRLDRTLADLFSFIDQRIGLENTVIVLSADHGTPEVPAYLIEQKLQGANISNKGWDSIVPIVRVKNNLGIKERLIEGYYHPYIYLNHNVITKHKLDLKEVQDQIAEALLSVEDVFHVVASNKIDNGQLADTQLNRAIKNNYYPSRSGDIYLIFKPQEFFNDLDGLKIAASHGSPWTYDNFVPIIFAGANIPAQHVFRRVETVDVAPTLSAILKIKAPSGSNGNILEEVFK